jgi:hypothetical protein
MSLGCSGVADSGLQYVAYERSGGQVPTYRPSARIEAAKLSANDRAELERLLKNADVVGQPETFTGARVPDSFEYRLTVSYANRTRTLIFHDQDGHPASLDALVNWIREHAEKQQ